MELYDVLKVRYSCRKYKPEPVSKELILKVMDVARKAPSGMNLQPWKFIAVTDAESREKLCEAYDREWFAAAPVIIAACSLTGVGYKRKYDGQDFTWVDVAIAFDHLTLAATNEGLGTCWIGAFREDVAKKALGVPDDVRVMAMTPLGYPDGEPAPRKPRKEMNEVLAWEKWE